MIFHAAKKHTPNLNRIIQSLENTKFRKKGSENVPILPRIQKKSMQGGDPPCKPPSDAKASKRRFAQVPPTYNKISVMDVFNKLYLVFLILDDFSSG